MLPADAPAIAACHLRTWQVAYRGQLPDEFLDDLSSLLDERVAFWARSIQEAPQRRVTQVVAVDGERVVGFATFGPRRPEDDPSVGELYAIYVDPDHWGTGYGRALVATAERGLRERGYREAVLWVLASNARSRRFYEIAGWTADGAAKTDHAVWGRAVELHEVRYRKRLE